eukprot:TRINITY_DN1632_c0_g1::TRINITY_DN1632_c0_g1_i1::g.17822::m.17822 TRINITY_DN1632_c0_g1::TRINITY_DN1632_c0_g1_i1::g.17822  ORF type:complete len:306 (+),score=94.83,sp/Q9W2N0/CAPZA_DROME/30.04/1e-50,F-actin_cap_A/PF01267.12/4.2e-72,CSTF2_hinge/PF14327.1/0.16 TRINITY_DN1632_c0_g1_i1:57-920(+)
MADEYASLSREDKISLCSTFVAGCPPGQMKEVLADIKILVDDDMSVLESVGTSACKKYNEENNVTLTVDNSYEVVLNAAGSLGGDKYVDPRGKHILTIDPVKLEVKAKEPLEGYPCEDFRHEIEKTLTEYVESHYPEGACSVYAHREGDHNTLTVALSAAKYSPGNYWSGRWHSTWTVSWRDGQKSGTISGVSKIRVHYYEDGNVQLMTENRHSTDVALEDGKAAGSAVCDAVSKSEGGYQKYLQELFTQMSDSSFKELRRKLPITQQRFDWEKVAMGRLARELTRK